MSCEFISAETPEEALEVLSAYKGEAEAIAGGTNLLLDIRRGIKRPGVVVDISRLPFKRIVVHDGWLRIGALVSIAEVLDDPLVAVHAPILREAAQRFAGPLVRNRATVGGNLADANPAADMALALVASDAEVVALSPRGERSIAIERFFLGPRENALEPDEILTEVRLRCRKPHEYSCFKKLGLRKAMAISVVSVGVILALDEDICREARIALGAVAPRPVRARAAEAALRGRAFNHETIEEAVQAVDSDISPISDVRASAAYRRDMARVYLRRALCKAAARGVEAGGVR